MDIPEFHEPRIRREVACITVRQLVLDEKGNDFVLPRDDLRVARVPRKMHGGVRELAKADESLFRRPFPKRLEEVILEVELQIVVRDRQVESRPQRTAEPHARHGDVRHGRTSEHNAANERQQSIIRIHCLHVHHSLNQNG